MSRQRKRGARGTKGRLASPTQMERLCTALGRELPGPVSFEKYRHMMREQRQPSSHLDTSMAAWEHLESKDTATSAMTQAFSQALHEERLARDAQKAP